MNTTLAMCREPNKELLILDFKLKLSRNTAIHATAFKRSCTAKKYKRQKVKTTPIV
jgi:hypothetical protein